MEAFLSLVEQLSPSQAEAVLALACFAPLAIPAAFFLLVNILAAPRS